MTLKVLLRYVRPLQIGLTLLGMYDSLSWNGWHVYSPTRLRMHVFKPGTWTTPMRTSAFPTGSLQFSNVITCISLSYSLPRPVRDAVPIRRWVGSSSILCDNHKSLLQTLSVWLFANRRYLKSNISIDFRFSDTRYRNIPAQLWCLPL